MSSIYFLTFIRPATTYIYTVNAAEPWRPLDASTHLAAIDIAWNWGGDTTVIALHIALYTELADTVIGQARHDVMAILDPSQKDEVRSRSFDCERYPFPDKCNQKSINLPFPDTTMKNIPLEGGKHLYIWIVFVRQLYQNRQSMPPVEGTHCPEVISPGVLAIYSSVGTLLPVGAPNETSCYPVRSCQNIDCMLQGMEKCRAIRTGNAVANYSN